MNILVPPINDIPLAPTERLPPDHEIGSLWRRIVAFAVDGMGMCLFGLAISVPFFSVFSRLGSWGTLIGFCLALPYFGLLNSRIGNGQTLGKRLMHLRVVDKNGNTISFAKSVGRYAVLSIPYYLNESLLPTSRTPHFVSVLLSLLIFGVGGATFYLVLFNRQTRQGLHDLAVGSYVADADKDGPLKIAPIWRWHFLIIGSLSIALFLGTDILGNKLEKSVNFPQLLEDVRLVEAMPGTQAAGAEDVNWTNWNGGYKKTILAVNVNWSGKAEDEVAFADSVAALILRDDPTVPRHDLFRVVIIRGYSLGIAHAQVSHSYEYSPAAWNSRLFGISSAPSQ